VHVAASPFTGLRDSCACPGHDQVGDHFAALVIEDHGTGRDAYDQVIGGPAILLLTAARVTIAGDQSWLIFEVEQGREAFIDLEDHTSATTTVTTGRAAEGPVFFTQKSNRAVTSLAGVNEHSRFVDEPHTADALYQSPVAPGRPP
jgi:hypothetical protein